MTWKGVPSMLRGHRVAFAVALVMTVLLLAWVGPRLIFGPEVRVAVV